MDTTTITRTLGRAAAILVGSAIALAPITDHASQAGALRHQVPTGPDIAISALVSLREAVEAHRGTVAAPGTSASTLRQLIEADRPALRDPEPAAAPPSRDARTQPPGVPNPQVERYGPIAPR